MYAERDTLTSDLSVCPSVTHCSIISKRKLSLFYGPPCRIDVEVGSTYDLSTLSPIRRSHYTAAAVYTYEVRVYRR